MFFTIVVVMVVKGTAISQTSEEAAIRKVIDQLFLGMERGDSTMARKTFARNANLYTLFRDKNNKPVLEHETSLKAFLDAVGTPHPDVWREEISNVIIHVDGDLGSVWCDYSFYAGKKFSHCGVDAFMLRRTDEGWKIFSLADTRRKAGCGEAVGN